MNSKNTVDLIIKFKNITDNFENELSNLILQARHLSNEEQKQIAAELKATIENINFMINSLPLK